MDLDLFFAGTGGSVPSARHGLPALLLRRGGDRVLFDCGEGTQRQMMRYGVGFSFSEIFFSHYHSDHMLGVIGLFRTMGLLDRKDGVTLYGPKHAQRILGGALSVGLERTKFPVEIIEVKAGDCLKRKEYEIQVFATDHRVDTVGYALVEKDRLGRFDPDLAKSMGIPEGPLWGQIHRGKSVTLPDGREVGPEGLVGPARPGRTVVYSGDTRPCPGLRDAAKGADLLIHEATFGAEEAARAVETGHSTAGEAARVARDAGVRRLVLTHISARYNREAPELLAEATAVFPATQIARDGMSVDVPFPDKTEP